MSQRMAEIVRILSELDLSAEHIGKALESYADSQPEKAHLIEAGRHAVDNIRQEGEDAELAPDEIAGLEAIILREGRPAIFIENDRFFPAPSKWAALLEPKRKVIQRLFPSVGQIQLSGHPTLTMIGTGFMVAEHVVITCRHVANIFCHRTGDNQWEIQPGITAFIDYAREWNEQRSNKFALTEVLGIHPVLDIALLKVADTSVQGNPLPPSLPIATTLQHPWEERNVLLIGHPGDDRRNRDQVQARGPIFENVYNVKRLQPGHIRTVSEVKPVLTHDCSTLGGNSGSCIVDLETNLVLGLHYAGEFLKENYAVPLWMLRDDPLFKQTNIPFTTI